MLTMHSMLLVGPYDWESAALPRAEFTQRLAEFWKRIPASCQGVFVHGDSRDHAALAWLTNFVPKVRNSMAFLPRQGEPVMLIAGSKAQFPSMKRLTWSDNLELLSDPAKAVLEAKDKLGGAAGIDFVGLDAMRGPMRKNVLEALGEGWRPGDASRVVEALMLRKSPREIEAIRGACVMLDAARTALEKAQRGGASTTAAVLEGEHAAHRLGAQDVRTLFSLDGGRTLIPFPGPGEARGDPLQAYFAVRSHGYWADGMMVVASAPNKALEQARRALGAVIKDCRPGAQASALGRRMNEALAPLACHSVTATEFGNAMGLSMETGPKLKQGGDERLEEGAVYSIRVGASGQEGHAIVSAMLVVQAQGAQVLWSSFPP